VEKSEQLRVENSMDLLITLLYAPGRKGIAEPIEGITRLQKLMFLLQQREKFSPKDLVDLAEKYQYEAYKMGPYAKQLNQDLEELESAGIVVTERLDYWLPDDMDSSPQTDADFDLPTRPTKRVQSSRFLLSEDLGLKKIGQELWESLTPKQRKELSDFKRFFNSLSLRQLLIFTYEKFPEYTSESTIKEHLGL